MKFERFAKGLLEFFPPRTRLALGLRVTLSAVLALFVAQALGLPMPLWSVLTAVIVDQLSVGRSLKTSTNYLLGTVGGSVYGGIIAVLVPHSSESMLLAVLVLTVAPLALYSASHANMNVVPISAIIVLLMPPSGICCIQRSIASSKWRSAPWLACLCRFLCCRRAPIDRRAWRRLVRLRRWRRP
jgi:uncharacterized membrane protein YccC